MSDPLRELKESLRSWAPPADAASMALPDEPSFAYAVGRFLASWAQAKKFGADQAVLLRQALRWGGFTTLNVGPLLASEFEVAQVLGRSGVDWDLSGVLHLRPFQPSWSEEIVRSDDKPIKRAPEESFPAESYLESIGYSSWRSPAQKEAAWLTLQAPPGSTRVVVLPTGSGKSLCFQLLPRFSSGLTVVVVPTVALAIDQQAKAAKLFADMPLVNPRYYASDDDPETALLALKEKRTRLMFTSPEACVSGRLRPVLDEFAKEGWLMNLVVDEAHLIETWGAQFRVEFQILAAARRAWRTASEDKLKTFLFSATMSKPCRELLQKLFSDDGVSREFVCQRLRPEIRYYSRQFPSKSQRDLAVIESLRHLPRPAILYVTKREDAEVFVSRLQGDGFGRIASFHGDTSKHDRKDILQRWKKNQIDLVVATSAFGVGVDKPDVRAVVHACYPENLDRYYQEVGRGGRDGWSSVSLLLTSPCDRAVAEGVTVQLMTTEMIQNRWSAMFAKAESRGDYVYALPVASRRIELVGTRTYGENIRWNKRLLLQLERANKLKLVDIEFRSSESPDDETEEWVVVKVDFPPHTPCLGQMIEAERNDEVVHFRGGLKKLDDFISGGVCAARVIGNLYGMPPHQRGCPGCSFCRAKGRQPMPCDPLDFPKAAPASMSFASELIEGCPSPISSLDRADFIELASLCVTSKGLRQFHIDAQHFAPVLACFKEAFPRNTPTLHRIDPIKSGSVLSSTASLPVVFFHVGQISVKALEAGRSYPSIHLFCGVQNPEDQNGRHVAVNERLRRWPTFDSWISEPPNNSLPCLPMTL